MSEGNRERRLGVAHDGTQPLFILSAAHELKAPLALIRQLSLGLQDENIAPSDIARLAERITLTSDRALRLTTDLTKSARLEDSLFAVEPINPIQVLEDALHVLEPLYKAKGKTLRQAPRLRPLLAIGNRELLHRILVNFGDNALHYSDDNSTVTFHAHRQGENVRVSVRDFGPAVPMDLWQRLPLGSHPSLYNRPESSGLGLLISRQFARAMNAELGICRHRDGATFYVDIPVSTQLSLL